MFRWQERNKGLDEAVATFRIQGLFGARTSVPVLVNLTTGDLIGYAGRLAFGQTLTIAPAGASDRRAQATLDGTDVSTRIFSVQGFELGVPFKREDLDAEPKSPRMARGANDWIFLSVGLYDVRGLNRFFFSIADRELFEASFDETFFDHALFPSGPIARLEMEWTETEPASFELRVPRYLVSEPEELVAASDERPFEQVGGALADSVAQLRAAGVRAKVEFVPFVETGSNSSSVHGRSGSSAHCFMPGKRSPFLRARPLLFPVLGAAGS